MRSKEFLLGVDIGTSSTKGVLIGSDGKPVAEASVEHDIKIIKSGWVEQDPEVCYWGDFKTVVRQLLIRSQISPSNIAGVGISGLTPDLVPIDKDGRVVRPAIIYMDRRAWKECEDLERRIGFKSIVERTGNINDPYYAGYKLIWYLKNEPDNYRKTWKVLDASKYVVFKLTGVPSIDRSTVMLYSPYYDVRDERWSDEISSMVGGGVDKLPNICETQSIIGSITPLAAKETGLEEGTIVVSPGPDAILSAYSVGMVHSGDSCFMYGTTGCWFVVVDKPLFDPRLINTYHVVPGNYIVVGGMIATGGLIRWFRDKFGHLEKDLSELMGATAYQLLDREAERVNPGSDGLIVLPYFMGERTPIWDVNARGMIFGLTLNHSRAHVYRALLEAGGYGLRHHMEIARSLGISVEEMLAVNGGARSKLWRQIISDITGVSQEYVKEALGAPFGDAFIAGVGAKLFKRIEDIKNYVNVGERTEPNSENHKTYSQMYRIYLNLYEHTREDCKALSSIWQ